MSYMKKVSVREVQHGLAKVLRLVERGEEIAVTRRARIVAKIVPATPPTKPQIDFESRLRAIYPRQLPQSRSLSKLILKDRTER
jgi:antitoxin (DNA-binding transcriptional repressor) of toxin-antitoxin stability system